MLTRRAMLGQASAVASAAWAIRAGSAVAAAGRSAVDFAVPRGACDCHVHVFGDPAAFPFAERRVYTPPQASVEQLLELQRDLHLDRVVVVQPSVYGADNACTLDAVRRMGARARGIAVIDKATSRKALEEMASAGIRGVRLNLEPIPRDGSSQPTPRRSWTPLPSKSADWVGTSKSIPAPLSSRG
jgi:predicted TIM-barrel fold metal-dependent hydrolase